MATIPASGFSLLLITALLLLAPPARADQLDDIKASGKLVVGIRDNSIPFSFRRPGEEAVIGYYMDLAGRVAQRLGVPIETVSLRDNRDRIPFLQQHKVDIEAMGTTRSKDRAQEIDFSYAYFVSTHRILVRKDGGIASIGQMAGRKLALTRTASVETELKSAVPSMEIVFFDDYGPCFAALKEGSADGFLADEILLKAMAAKDGAPERYALIMDYDLPRSTGFALRKNEPRLKDLVNTTLLDLEASGEAARIYDAWFEKGTRSFRFQPD